MPCYQRTTVNVDLSAATNVEALVAGLTELGARLTIKSEREIRGQDENGRALRWTKGIGLIVDSASALTNQAAVKKAYGAAVVRANAVRYGWNVNKKEAGVLELSRRRY